MVKHEMEFANLIEEDNYVTKETIRYKYDIHGNMLYKQVFELNTYHQKEQDKYEYQNSNWVDQLTKYNNQEITYDEIGNPIKIGNNTLTWMNGQTLKSYNVTNYKYNEDGIRVQKEGNGFVVEYYVEGSNIIYEKFINDIMIYYLRDGASGLIGFKYQEGNMENTYYYLKNAQNDIIGIIDRDNHVIARYEYDSWGNLISIKDAEGNDIPDNPIASINSYRYRSYFYDHESGLYYLNNRYYDPQYGRFISPDSYIFTAQDMQSTNMYLYTENNPVSRMDSNGYLWIFTVVAAVVSAGISVVANGALNLSQGKDFFDNWEGAAASGLFTGAVATTPFGLTPIGGLVSGYGGSFIESVVNGGDVVQDTLINGTFSYFIDKNMPKKYKVNNGMVRPYTYNGAITGNYQKRLTQSAVIGAGVGLPASTLAYTIQKLLDDNSSSQSPIKIGTSNGHCLPPSERQLMTFLAYDHSYSRGIVLLSYPNLCLLP